MWGIGPLRTTLYLEGGSWNKFLWALDSKVKALLMKINYIYSNVTSHSWCILTASPKSIWHKKFFGAWSIDLEIHCLWWHCCIWSSDWLGFEISCWIWSWQLVCKQWKRICLVRHKHGRACTFLSLYNRYFVMSVMVTVSPNQIIINFVELLYSYCLLFRPLSNCLQLFRPLSND